MGERRKQLSRDSAAADQDGQDAVFGALSHPARRRMLDLLQAEPGLTIAALCAHFDMSAVGVLKHVRVLEAASLVLSHKKGRERLLYVNLVPIQIIYDRWTDVYGVFWAGRLTDLKDRIEQSTSRKAARSA
jgi:DNA-binding transcriptional ArsR family regulator